MKSSYDLFIFAGEPSADLHGEALLIELYKQNPDLKILAVAGPKMRKTGVDCLLRMEEFQVMGFIDVFLALPKLLKNFIFISKHLLQLKPKAALFIDYPGFNLRMEKYLKKKGFRGKILHYVCPSVWIHGKGRIKTMESSLDELYTILPFERDSFINSPLPVEYVGHPLVSRISSYTHAPILELADKNVIAIFPGSRSKEVERNLPLYLTLIKNWTKIYKDLHFAISVTREELRPLIDKLIELAGLNNSSFISLIDPSRTYDLMKTCFAAIAKSGTVTLELGLFEVPTVVTYAARTFDIFIAKYILKVNLPYYSLPNILCKKQVFPELIGPFFTYENLEKQAKKLLDEDYRKDCVENCIKLKEILGNKKASEQVAHSILKHLQSIGK